MFLIRTAILMFIATSCVHQAEAQERCEQAGRECLLELLGETIEQIDNASWRDTSYREYAKTLAFDGRAGEAVALISEIENPDTRAMTIRGIGMAVADNGSGPDVYRPVFEKLKIEADKISHPPSHAIAMTYIAMAQAFAGDDDAATKTATSMENDALRNKAFGENAEIQAERGDFDAAVSSISHIESPSFRDKAHSTVSQIFAKAGNFTDALKTALRIENTTLRAECIQFILDRQKPREVEKGKAGK